MAWVRKAPSGRWQARWRDPGGKHKVKTFRLRRDAEKFLVSIEDSMHRGAYHDPNAGRETLGAFWGEARAAAMRTGRLSERTLISYDEIWRLYLERALGDHPLNTISQADVEEVVSTCPSTSRARDVHKVLRAILGRAVKAGRSPRTPRPGSNYRKSSTASHGRCHRRNSSASWTRCPTGGWPSFSSPRTRRCGSPN